MTPQRDASVAKPTDIRERILDSVVSWAAVTGMRKISMDEVARHAGVGRATLYKYFPGREALIAAAVQSELGKFFSDVQRVVDRYSEADDRLMHGFAHAYRVLANHPAVRKVLDVNPEPLLPYVITSNSYALDLGRTFVAAMDPLDELPPRARIQFGEYVARAFHTLILIPSRELGLDEPDGPENYARNFLLPVKHHLAASFG